MRLCYAYDHLNVFIQCFNHVSLFFLAMVSNFRKKNELRIELVFLVSILFYHCRIKRLLSFLIGYFNYTPAVHVSEHADEENYLWDVLIPKLIIQLSFSQPFLVQLRLRFKSFQLHNFMKTNHRETTLFVKKIKNCDLPLFN